MLELALVLGLFVVVVVVVVGGGEGVVFPAAVSPVLRILSVACLPLHPRCGTYPCDQTSALHDTPPPPLFPCDAPRLHIPGLSAIEHVIHSSVDALPPNQYLFCVVCWYVSLFTPRPTKRRHLHNTDGFRQHKQLPQSLEKAKVDMDADLKARAEEHQLSLKLREQWQQKMRVSAMLDPWGRRRGRGGRWGGGRCRLGWCRGMVKGEG